MKATAAPAETARPTAATARASERERLAWERAVASRSADEDPRHRKFGDSEVKQPTKTRCGGEYADTALRASKQMTRSICEIFHKRVFFDVNPAGYGPISQSKWPSQPFSTKRPSRKETNVS